MGSSVSSAPQVIGRYAIYDVIAAGGMATVHLGRLVGPVGFARTVAIKRLHAQYAKDPEFATMFLDEARLAARIHHPNVVPTLDVVATGGELFLVMEYVKGESLSRLLRLVGALGQRMPPPIVVSIVSGALEGLHAAHEAKDESGRPLGLVHRDVSPQNILVGIDGTARVLDFGVAKAEGQVHTTRDGQLKGKILYMPPEQLEGHTITRATDVYSMGVVLFEALTGHRMFHGENEVGQLAKILRNEVKLPSRVVPDLPRAFDEVVRRATAKEAADRFATAREMALAVGRCEAPSSAAEVAEWVQSIAGARIHERTRRIAEIESASKVDRSQLRGALAQELSRAEEPTSVPSISQVSAPVDSQSSQAGSISYSAVQFSPVSRWKRRAFAVLVLAVAVPVVAYALRLRGKVTEEPAAPPVASAPPVEPAAPALSTSASSSAGSTAASAPTATASLEPAPNATASTALVPPVSTARSGGSRGSVPASPKKPNCDRPYTIDSAGHMRFREECL